LGKITANAIRDEMAARNENPAHPFSDLDTINAAYLQMLFNKKIEGLPGT
jgi:hypothetical protein